MLGSNPKSRNLRTYNANAFMKPKYNDNPYIYDTGSVCCIKARQGRQAQQQKRCSHCEHTQIIHHLRHSPTVSKWPLSKASIPKHGIQRGHQNRHQSSGWPPSHPMHLNMESSASQVLVLLLDGKYQKIWSCCRLI